MASGRIHLAGIIVFALLSMRFAPTSWAVPEKIPGYVQGTIIDSTTEEPIAWAWIRITCTSSRASDTGSSRTSKAIEVQNLLSDEEGSFISKPLEPGEYALEVSHISYRSLDVVTVEIKPEQASRVTVKLWPLLYEQAPVVITAMRSISSNAALVRTIRRETLSGTPGTFEDPLRVLARTPGVETQSDFDGRLSFRSGSPEEAGYSLDGIPIPAAYHFGGVTSIFNPSAVDMIKSYASAHPASLGPGTAGYVEVRTRSNTGRERPRRLEISPITMGFLWGRESGDKHLSAIVSLRRTYHDLVLKAMGKEKGFTVPNFFDGEFRTRFRPSRVHEFSLSMLRSGDRVSMGIDGIASAASANRVTVTSDLSRVSLGWEARPQGMSLGGGASLSYQPYEYDMRIQGADNESMDWDSKSIIFSGHLFMLSGNHLIELGALAMEQNLRYSVSMARGFWKLWSGPLTEGSLEGDPMTLSARGIKSTSYRALYIQEKWAPPAERFSLTAGLRGESFAASREQFLSPRISLQYNFRSSEAHIAWGIYRSHPLDKPGNPSGTGEGILSLRAEHLVLGYGKKVGSLGTLALDLYSRWTKHVLAEVAPGIFASTGVGKAYGVDVEWQRRTDRWETTASYSFGRSFRLDPDGALLRTFEQDETGNYTNAWYHGPKEWHPDNFDLGHSLNLSAGFDLGAQAHLSLTWAYRSGRRITPIVDVVHSHEGRAFGVEGMPGGARLRPYHRLDVRMSKRFHTRWGIMETYLDIANLYNRTNLFQSIYNRDYTNRKEYRTLPFIPTLGLAMEF